MPSMERMNEPQPRKSQEMPSVSMKFRRVGPLSPGLAGAGLAGGAAVTAVLDAAAGGAPAAMFWFASDIGQPNRRRERTWPEVAEVRVCLPGASCPHALCRVELSERCSWVFAVVNRFTDKVR